MRDQHQKEVSVYGFIPVKYSYLIPLSISQLVIVIRTSLDKNERNIAQRYFESRAPQKVDLSILYGLIAVSTEGREGEYPHMIKKEELYNRLAFMGILVQRKIKIRNCFNLRELRYKRRSATQSKRGNKM